MMAAICEALGVLSFSNRPLRLACQCTVFISDSMERPIQTGLPAALALYQSGLLLIYMQ